METKWMGLWKQRDGVYAGQVIKKSDIPKYTRIVVRYNKFYEKDSNKPKFVYRFVDSEGYEKNCVPIEIDENSVQSKIEKLADIMREGNLNGEFMALPSESAGRAQNLMLSAIKLIEEITGEKWDFSYMTF